MDNLAYYNHRAGRFEDAARLGEQMVDLSRKVLGTTNNVTIHRTGQLAEYCRSVGKYERAIQLRRDVLSARRSISGRDHDDTVADIKSLADTYAHQGRWIEARNVLMELGAIENLPDSSPLALMALPHWTPTWVSALLTRPTAN